MKNIIYFFYYIKITNWKRLFFDVNYVINNKKKSRFALLIDIIKCTFKYGSAFNEYFYYSFYEKSVSQRKEYASMGFMYEYQKKCNPPSQREILANKILFFEKYKDYIGRNWLKIFESDLTHISAFLEGKEKIVLKGSKGGGGKNVLIVFLDNMSVENLAQEAKKLNLDILEEFVYQHPDMNRLAPNSLNTIRVITQYTPNKKVDIVGATLRMGIDKNTDNLSSGGLACGVNISTGKIDTDGISFDIGKTNLAQHPISGITFIGFQIPYWKEILNLCKKIAFNNSENTSVGWDIAIKKEGPIVIEGNHDWGARVWQMPYNRGFKYKLLKYKIMD